MLANILKQLHTKYKVNPCSFFFQTIFSICATPFGNRSWKKEGGYRKTRAGICTWFTSESYANVTFTPTAIGIAPHAVESVGKMADFRRLQPLSERWLRREGRSQFCSDPGGCCVTEVNRGLRSPQLH